MRKILRQYGGSLILTFGRQEKEIYDLHEGDIIDIELVKIKRRNNGRKKES